MAFLLPCISFTSVSRYVIWKSHIEESASSSLVLTAVLRGGTFATFFGANLMVMVRISPLLARCVPGLLFLLGLNRHVCIQLSHFFCLFFVARIMVWTERTARLNHTQPQLTFVWVFFGRIWRLGFFSGSRLLVSAMIDLAFGGWQSLKYPRLY